MVHRSSTSGWWKRTRGSEISMPQDCSVAEQKLNRWLVKPTDGVFARMNRRISIPISRQLIKFPITPNMVSRFTLGVSLVAGASYAMGGYLNTLVGAILSVWASILDGCDGEVARLKFQAIRFWMLAGDCVRLPLLPVHLCRNGDRPGTQFGKSRLLGMGCGASVWRRSHDPACVVRA